MDFLSHGKLQEIKALHGFRTCQAQVHLSAIAGGVLKGNMDGQPFFCEIIEILVVSIAPKGCWEPQGHSRLAEKTSASWWPTRTFPASGLPFWCPNSQWVFLLSFQRWAWSCPSILGLLCCWRQGTVYTTILTWLPRERYDLVAIKSELSLNASLQTERGVSMSC